MVSETISETKICIGCKQSFPRTSEYFPSDKTKGDGFRADCRACRRARRRINNRTRRTRAGQLAKIQKDLTPQEKRETLARVNAYKRLAQLHTHDYLRFLREERDRAGLDLKTVTWHDL